MKNTITSKLRPLSVVLTGILFMALSLIFVKLVSLPAPLVAMLRALISWILLSLFFGSKIKMKLEKPSHYYTLIAGGVCLALSWTLVFESISLTSVVVAATAYFLFPIWTVLRNFSEVKPISLMDVIMIVGFGSALYLLVPEWSFENETTIGVLLAFLGASFAVVQRWISESILDKYEDETFLYFHWGIAALVLIPYGLFVDFQVSMMDITWLFLLSLLSTIAAQGLFFSGSYFIHLSLLSAIFSLQPLIIAGLARVFLGEIVSSTVMIAAVIVSLIGSFYHVALYFMSSDFIKPMTPAKKADLRMRLIDYWIQEKNRRYEE